MTENAKKQYIAFEKAKRTEVKALHDKGQPTAYDIAIEKFMVLGEAICTLATYPQLDTYKHLAKSQVRELRVFSGFLFEVLENLKSHNILCFVKGGGTTIKSGAEVNESYRAKAENFTGLNYHPVQLMTSLANAALSYLQICLPERRQIFYDTHYSIVVSCRMLSGTLKLTPIDLSDEIESIFEQIEKDSE